MRSLAIARLRLLTRIRTANASFALASIPALVLAVAASWLPENMFRATFPFVAPMIATFTIFVFILHAGVLLIGSETAGQLHPQREGAEWSDLMETVPIGVAGRYWGEVLGSLGINLTIHLCTLPLLALVAVLSPLPVIVFVILEGIVLLLLSMGSAAAAWKRCARPTKWSATRMARSGLLFWILFVVILNATSRWDAFLGSIEGLITRPSQQTWSITLSAIERPVQLVVLIALLCVSYFAFYYVSSVRGLARRRGI